MQHEWSAMKCMLVDQPAGYSTKRQPVRTRLHKTLEDLHAASGLRLEKGVVRLLDVHVKDARVRHCRAAHAARERLHIVAATAGIFFLDDIAYSCILQTVRRYLPWGRRPLS